MFLGILLCVGLLPRATLTSVLPRGGDNYGGHPTINHNAVIALPQMTSSGFAGQLEAKYNPLLFVSGGCDPYPAVNADGSLGAGLRPTGGGRSGCDDGGKAQVYIRRGISNGHRGIMYSYYVPKVRWGKGDEEGHRHYWASVVVWIAKSTCDGAAMKDLRSVGISFTTDHEAWGSARGDQTSAFHVQIHDNAISPYSGRDDGRLFQRTLVSWDSLDKVVQQALNDVRPGVLSDEVMREELRAMRVSHTT
ncbi:NPP1 domain-containing protein [Colletotrichum nymphaeae SA-01]|uniref:NPP1 domain-containing protein n=1 Tax=Colletotrichum nymphaeae SA-01 TaxID=1460502 RepID=A0A135T378_9PEZI|nr:NPP1 domain-containing protein [Colletotrichum nymphaeae SA-01]